MLITNAKLITWEADNRVLEDHALEVEAAGAQREVRTI